MSDFEMINEYPKKPKKYTIDREYMDKLESEYERYKRKKEEQLEKEIEELQKIMVEQDKILKEYGYKQPVELEYDEKGHIIVDINDKRQMKLWTE